MRNIVVVRRMLARGSTHRLGWAAFLFFLGKGILWLAVPAVVALTRR
jgi:hypothetical protein